MVLPRLILQEPASKIWVAYAENERKTSFLHLEKLQNQIQSVSVLIELIYEMFYGEMHFVQLRRKFIIFCNYTMSIPDLI